MPPGVLWAPLMETAWRNDYKALETNSSVLNGPEHFLSNFPLNLAVIAVFPLHVDSFMSQLSDLDRKLTR